MLEATTRQWGGRADLWIFGYGSLVWRPDFDFAEQRFATVYGYHRALKMWSRINRGTPECPGLVFGLLPGGSCRGVVFRVPRAKVAALLPVLWSREMPTGVYDPKWLRCRTARGDVSALAFTLSKASPNYTGILSDAAYQQIFSKACGRYGSTHEYAQTTYEKLLALGIRDHALEQLLRLAKDRKGGSCPLPEQ